MKKQLFPLAACCILLLTRCQSPSDQILKEFKKVNSAIDRSNGIVTQKNLLAYYEFIKTTRDKNPQMVAQADSLYSATAAALRYLDGLTQQLIAKDSTGERKAPVRQLLLHTRAGDTIRAHVLNVAQYAYDGLMEKERRPGLDSALTIIQEISLQKNWTETYLKDTPTAGALTLLAKLKYDCINATAITLGTMIDHSGSKQH